MNTCQGGAYRVLVAAENLVQAHLLHNALERAGYSVMVAASGEEAIDLLSNESQLPELLLVDEDLPGISAYEVVGTLRYLDRRDEVPVVLRSHSLDQTTRVACLAAGVDAWLPIPVERKVLVETVGRLVSPAPAVEQRVAV